MSTVQTVAVTFRISCPRTANWPRKLKSHVQERLIGHANPIPMSKNIRPFFIRQFSCAYTKSCRDNHRKFLKKPLIVLLVGSYHHVRLMLASLYQGGKIALGQKLINRNE